MTTNLLYFDRFGVSLPSDMLLDVFLGTDTAINLHLTLTPDFDQTAGELHFFIDAAASIDVNLKFDQGGLIQALGKGPLAHMTFTYEKKEEVHTKNTVLLPGFSSSDDEGDAEDAGSNLDIAALSRNDLKRLAKALKITSGSVKEVIAQIEAKDSEVVAGLAEELGIQVPVVERADASSEIGLDYPDDLVYTVQEEFGKTRFHEQATYSTFLMLLGASGTVKADSLQGLVEACSVYNQALSRIANFETERPTPTLVQPDDEDDDIGVESVTEKALSEVAQTTEDSSSVRKALADATAAIEKRLSRYKSIDLTFKVAGLRSGLQSEQGLVVHTVLALLSQMRDEAVVVPLAPEVSEDGIMLPLEDSDVDAILDRARAATTAAIRSTITPITLE